MTADQTAHANDSMPAEAADAVGGSTPGSGASRRVSRRAVIAAGGAIGAAGVLAACGGGGDAGPTTTSATGAAPDPTTPTTSAPAPTTTGSVPDGALAPVSDIPVGGGQVFDGPKIVVTQPADGNIQAFTAVCPHQGCLVTEVANNEILCPCHGSLFSAENGDVIRGPAVQGLAGASVNIVDGYIVAG